jgi:hypothetical protein
MEVGVQNLDTMSPNDAMPQKNGAMPQKNGAMPEKNKAVPEKKGAMPEKKGAMPQKKRAMPQRMFAMSIPEFAARFQRAYAGDAGEGTDTLSALRLRVRFPVHLDQLPIVEVGVLLGRRKRDVA